MEVIRKYNDEEIWEEVSLERCLELTEGRGYWKTGTVIRMLEENVLITTPWAQFKAAKS